MNERDLEQRLRADFDYPEAGARLVATRLGRLQEPVRSSFATWWTEGGAPPPVEVEGYTVERLKQEHGMTPIAAFLTLDWLAREPERAQASLARGHDHVKSP